MSLQWRRLRRQLDALDLPDGLSLDSERPILHVDIDQQLLAVLRPDDPVLRYYPVSTAINGRGQREGSYCTPTGWHRIAQCVGEGEPMGRVFRGRRPTDQILLSGDDHGEEDVITTRILWLEGLEPGHNRGGDCDSHARYIYLHGTPDEANIGRPVSKGCIRLRNSDMVELFEQVRVGDALLIE